jgi:predicted amidohydrolase YtcJ
MRKLAGILVLITVALFLDSCGREVKMADTIFVNAAIWTGQPDRPWAEAIAIRGDRILAVGSREAVLRSVGRRAKAVDLGQRLVLPGFIDSHTHFLDGGFALLSIQLRDARSRAEFTARIAAKAKTLEKGQWILNGDWDQTRFDPPELPRREWIDAVTPDNPVFVNRLDAHMSLANGLALKLAGITRDTPNPPGGEILRDPRTGEPTGILKDAAKDLVEARIPAPSLGEKMKAAETALAHAAGLGLTSITEMADASRFEVYRELDRQGRLTCRLTVYVPIDQVDHPDRLKALVPTADGLLRFGGLKGFVDGSLGSSTALFFEPYTDDPSKRGLFAEQMYPDGVMARRLLAADKAGLQVAVHAIGDRANAIILDLYEATFKAGPARDRRWRVEHAQHLRPSDVPRFGRLGVIASVQPYHASDDGRWAERKIGSKRAETTYAFRSLLSTGAVLACGSDWTVAPLDPLTGVYAAVTRRTIDGRHPDGWIPEQKITLEEALRGYTMYGAYAEFAETEKGTLEPGKLADLVVLDRDFFKLGPDGIPGTKPLLTMVGGRVVFQAEPAKPASSAPGDRTKS